jgi:hypothetical protein
VEEYRNSSTLSLTSALDGAGGQHHAPAALPPGMTQHSFYRRLGGSQDRYRRVRKISPLPGFDPQTVELVASGYKRDYIYRLYIASVRIYIYIYTVYNMMLSVRPRYDISQFRHYIAIFALRTCAIQ